MNELEKRIEKLEKRFNELENELTLKVIQTTIETVNDYFNKEADINE